MAILPINHFTTGLPLLHHASRPCGHLLVPLSSPMIKVPVLAAALCAQEVGDAVKTFLQSFVVLSLHFDIACDLIHKAKVDHGHLSGVSAWVSKCNKCKVSNVGVSGVWWRLEGRPSDHDAAADTQGDKNWPEH